VIDKIKKASADNNYSAREILEDAKEYADAVKDVLGKEEYKEIMLEYADVLSSLLLKGILK
jgi:hypothetical protein